MTVFFSHIFPEKKKKKGNSALLGIVCEKEQNQCLLVVYRSRNFRQILMTDILTLISGLTQIFNTKIVLIQKLEKYYKFQNCSSEKSLVSINSF